MNQTPLLLNYRMRSHYNGTECRIDSDTGNLDSIWKSYSASTYEAWRLQLPDRQNFLCYPDDESNGNIMYFRRWGIHVLGDDDPIIVYFSYFMDPEKHDTVRTYQLPDGNKTIQQSPIIFDRRFVSVLQEYERCRTEWEIRTIVAK